MSANGYNWTIGSYQCCQCITVTAAPCKCTQLSLTLRGTLLTCKYFHDVDVDVVVVAADCSMTQSRDGQAVSNDNELAYIVVVTGCELSDNDDNDVTPSPRPRIIVVVVSSVTRTSRVTDTQAPVHQSTTRR